MNRHLEMVLALCILAVVGVWGAIASKAVKEGAHWAWYYSAGMAGIATWTWMTKRSPWNLLISSLAWDIVYNIAFLGTMIVYLHEAGSRGQVVGAVLIVLGLIAMNF
jgi:drug/metabolite transporter (DMT)-like permease